MKIQILPNINIFYVFLSLNLIGYDDNNGYDMHSLRVKVRKDWKLIVNTPKIIELSSLYNSNKIYTSYLIRIALYSSDNFEKIGNVPNLVDVSNYPIHLKFIELLKDIIEENKWNKYYNSNIKNEYNEIISSLSSDTLDIDLETPFKDIWGFLLDRNGIIYPNPLEEFGRAKGVDKDNNIISISGANKFNPDTQEMGFSRFSLLRNFIHEACHFYMDVINTKATQLHTNEFKTKTDKLFERLKERESLECFENYSYWDMYLEETFVKVMTISFLSPRILNTTKEEIIRRKNLEIKNGYYLYEIIENAIRVSFNNKEGMEYALVCAVNDAIKKY